MKKKRYHYLALLLGFILSIHEGYISLFSDSGELLQRFSYRAEFLPDADRTALERGIRIGSKQELAQLLEDYLS